MIVVAGVVLLAAIVSGIGVYGSSDEAPTAGLTVGWGGSEGHPSCVYDPKDDTVDVTITIEGEAPSPDDVTVTVRAYADENTSERVGSSSRSMPVEGTRAPAARRHHRGREPPSRRRGRRNCLHPLSEDRYPLRTGVRGQTASRSYAVDH